MATGHSSTLVTAVIIYIMFITEVVQVPFTIVLPTEVHKLSSNWLCQMSTTK